MPTPSPSCLYCKPSAPPWKSSRTSRPHLRIERKNCGSAKSNPFLWHGTANWDDGDLNLVITTSRSKASERSSFLHQPVRTFPQQRIGAFLPQSTHSIQNGI